MSRPRELYAALLAREFPAQALLRLRDGLRGQPCVVMEGEPPVQQAVSLNARARELGVARGMTKVEVDTVPGVTVLRRSRDEENAARAILLESAGGFSPRVEECVEEGSFLCVIDIAGTESLFGSPRTLAEKLLARVRALGIAASVAVSRNFHTAIASAKATAAHHFQIVPAGGEAAALASLPLAVLNLTEDQAEIFSMWGIRTLGMLAELPEKELIARMGQAGNRLRQLARGETLHLFQAVEPVFLLQERMELDSPVELLDALMFVVNVMLQQLLIRATARVVALAAATVNLILEGGAIYACTVRPALPSTDKQIWLRLLHLELEAHPPQAAILAVALEATAGATSKVQMGLFSPQLPEPSRLDVTLARIRALVGDGNVGRPLLQDTNRMDGFSMEPFRIPASRPTETVSHPLRPAMRMLRPAEMAFVTLQGQRPKTFHFRDRRYSVERAYGPWMSGGDWWNSTLWGCEQWDLVARARRWKRAVLLPGARPDAGRLADGGAL